MERPDRLVPERHRQLADLLREKMANTFPSEVSLSGHRNTTDPMWQKLQHLAITRLRVAEEWLEIGYQFAEDTAQQTHLDDPADQTTVLGR